MKTFLSNARCGAIAVVMLAVASQGAVAQEISDSHAAAARAAIASISATDPFDSILPEVAEGLRARLIANNPDLEGEISDIVTEEAVNLAARRADLEREAALIYARAFREEDLQAIADFYNTDAGKALLANGPIVTREVAGAAVVWRRGLERDLQLAVGGRLAESNPRGIVPPADAETAPAEGETATE